MVALPPVFVSMVVDEVSRDIQSTYNPRYAGSAIG